LHPEEGIGPSQLGIVVVVVLLEVVGVAFPVCAPVIPASQLKKSVIGSAASAGVDARETAKIESASKTKADLLQPIPNYLKAHL